MGLFSKEGGHYSVRESCRVTGAWKIVIAYTDGSGYDDIDVPMYVSFEAAMEVAERMNRLKDRGL